MEFFPGAFEQEWERRRAMLMHEMQMGQTGRLDWDEPRRGGMARLADEGSGGFGRARPRKGGGATGRSMRTRFSAVARGGQPAVVKLASYGGGGRAGAMMSYTSRGGELAVENERGERVVGREALAEQCGEWEHLFNNRTASRDLGVFDVSVDASALSNDRDQDDQLREILRSGFGDRRFVYAAREHCEGELRVSGVVVLRDANGERLTGDRKAAEIIQQRHGESESGRDVEARFRFRGYGNGVEWGTARVRELVASTDAEVRDNTSRLIGDATQAGDLVQQGWRRELHSRKGRDVMHLIVSARAGTDGPAFEGAVREFLGEQFSGHRYVFAIHDPALDPKDLAEGGKRPHIHAHAIVTMRSETGERIVTSPQTFRDWRSLMAEKAREQGIDMELTDRREFASAPAYTRNQVRPLSYRGRTEHEGTSAAAHSRYLAKRSNEINTATTDRSRQYAGAAVEAWNDLAAEERGTREGAFARQQSQRLDALRENSQKEHKFLMNDLNTIKKDADIIELVELVQGEDGQMREMTRLEFEAYEMRVEAVISSVEQTLDASERAEFNEVAATAREVVDIRREYLEFIERQTDRDIEPMTREPRDDRHQDDANAQWDAAVARFGLRAVETANEVLVEVSHYREGLERIEAEDLLQSFTASYRAGLDREINQAGELAVDGDNQYLREIAKSDQELQRTIEQIKLSRTQDRRDVSLGGARNADAPGVALNDGKQEGLGSIHGRNEAEQLRDPDLDASLRLEADEHTGEQQPSMPAEQRARSPERAAERKPALDAEPVRSDPPQQFVPRLHQIELEFGERLEGERDERER